MKIRGKFEALLFFCVGVYLIYTLSSGLYSGEFTMLKRGNTITADSDPYKFWTVVGLQALTISLIIYLLFGESYRHYWSRKKRNNLHIRPIENYLSEVQVLIKYGKEAKALDLVSEAPEHYPENSKLLHLKTIASNKRFKLIRHANARLSI